MASPKKDNLRFMDGIKAYFYEPGIGKTRISILCRQLKKYCGMVATNFDSNVTHIIMSKNAKIDRLLKTIKVSKIDESIEVLDADWLSACFMECKQCDASPYLIKTGTSAEKVTRTPEKDKSNITVQKNLPDGNTSLLVAGQGAADSTAHTFTDKLSPKKSEELFQFRRKRRHSCNKDSSDTESSYEGSDDESKQTSPTKQAAVSSPGKPKGVWVCTKPSTSAGQNLNEHITEKLEVLAKAYTNTQDRWRALGYRKAISAIKNHPKRIETSEEVKSLPFVGERLAKKIIEILETGHLRRLDHMDPNIDVINMFNDVWGAGPKTAETWVAQGFRSLDDLREKADLTYQQKIGLKFYEEFLEKIDRNEVEEIGNCVKETACELIPGMEVVTCGSYRRGRPKCGDVDILISHPDGRSHRGFLMAILDALQKKGLITDDLITVDNEEQRKYMGVFKLPGEGQKHRRLDIIVAPYAEWACALVHFTGSGRLNRSMRQLAKTKDMSLSEHALREGVVRKGHEKIHKGSVIPVFSEEDIFCHLGLDYLHPHERDW